MKYFFVWSLTAMGLYFAWWSDDEAHNTYAILCFIFAHSEANYLQLKSKIDDMVL